MSKVLWLIRHSESQGNLERRIQGWVDYPLSQLGRRQAARLADRLAGETSISELIASPLERAAHTAQIVGSVLGLEVRYDERLKEYDFGPISGLSRDEIAERHPQVWAGWQINEFWQPLPGEEGEPAFEARVRSAMDEVVAAMDDGTAVAVVTHGGVLNACLRSWLGIVERGWRTFAFDNASISLVQLQASLRRGGAAGSNHNYRLLELNDVAHLGDLRGRRPAWFSASRAPGKVEQEA